jgi:secreted PhoX family phosphatase
MTAEAATALSGAVTRRVFVKGLAVTGTLVAATAAPASAAPSANGRSRPSPFWSGWRAQAPSDQDDITLPPGFTYDLVASYRDPIGRGLTFGYNNDYTAYFPLSHGHGKDEEGLLWVNHEYPDPFFIHGNANPATKTPAQIELEQHAVGGSIIHVKRGRDGRWRLRRDGRYARRITGTTPAIKMTGAGIGPTGNPAFAPIPEVAHGSLANCAGGFTPWGTALSAEENWADYGLTSGFGYGWGPAFLPANNGDYGWILEVDPFDPSSTPRKHTNLGRIRHENATLWTREGEHLVAYTGDDARDKFLYKYISEGRYRRHKGKANSALFERGQLYVAEWAPASQDETVLSGTGSWHEVEMSPAALTDPDGWVRRQPWFNAATFQLNRPEDAEIDRADNALYTALTNNTDDPHGRIRRLGEEGGDPTSTASFAWADVAVGGPDPGVKRGFSSPDNLVFDKLGNLWMVTDISTSSLNVPGNVYAYHKNNGIFMIRLGGDGPQEGLAFRFGSVPNQAESTGPFWNPRQDTMFLAIQHPGEETAVRGGVYGDPSTYLSWWPHGNKTAGRNPSEPLPSVVAIRKG